MTGPDLRDDLPPTDVLQSWTTPPVPAGLTDQVMAAFEESEMPVQTHDPDLWRAQETTRRPVGLWIAMAAAVVAVIALGTAVYGPSGPDTSVAAVAAPPAAAPPSTPALAPALAPAAAQTAAVVITTDPVDASVRVDGKPVEGPTPHVLGTVNTGPLHITVERKGYVPFERQVDLGPGGLQLPVQLQQVAPAPNLKSPFPTRGDKRDLKDPFARSKQKPTKKSSSGLKSPFGSPALEDPFAKSGSGSLQVGTEAGTPTATVFVDGRRVGTTPQMNIPLGAGGHQVKCQWDDGQQVVKVFIKPDKRASLRCRKP